MLDIEEVIDYMRLLRRGFDKDLFQSKVEELAQIVDNDGLDYEDFHVLFKVWLNLSISITKWQSIGICLVPKHIVEERTVDYALRWILANCSQQGSFSRIAFLLDWLTAAMDCDAIDMTALDCGYGIFYDLLMYDILTAHVLKLIYTLTKPADVTRRRVVEILDYAKRNEKKNKQFQVILGLFKSYKSVCVPENVPAISVNTTFKKINVALLNRFKRSQVRSDGLNKDKHLLWEYPFNSDRGNKNIEPLIPSMTYYNAGSSQYSNSEQQKSYLDFTDAVSLCQYSLQHKMSRPARLRALLCNEAGLMLLAVTPDVDHDFLSRDLCHVFKACYLSSSPHSYTEKRHFLHRLVLLQRTLMQGIAIVTDFLAQFLPLWNEKDYFAEVLKLAEWVHVDSPENVGCIVDSLARIYYRAQPLEQCAILNALTNMYTNVVYSSMRKTKHMLNQDLENDKLPEVLLKIASSVREMCNKGLQIDPEDIRTSFSSARAFACMSMSELRGGRCTTVLPPPLCLAMPILDISAALLDHAAYLVLTYKKIFVANRERKDETFIGQMKILKSYTCDLVRCLYEEEAFSGRDAGYIFHRVKSEFVERLCTEVPGSDGAFSIRNNMQFLPYTCAVLEKAGDISNKLCFRPIEQDIPNLSEFLKKALPELR